ncbi:MAG TPA: MFS transporter, partial [Polyangia bacterium]|nr:MFS transporter [Polyangia bacterium]
MNPATLISVFYALWFMNVGINTPYLAPYLSGRGLSGTQIATVLSLIPLSNLGVPIAWAWIADRTHRHERVLRVVCFGSAVGVTLLLRAHDFAGVLLGFGVFALFYVGAGPLVDTLAVALSHEGRGYGRVRIWGSFGFLVAAAVGGLILTGRGNRPADPAVPGMMLVGVVSAGIASLFVKGHATPPPARPHLSEIGTLLKDRRFRLLLAVGTLHWMGLA